MNDEQIVELYFKRDELAIRETKHKYENYLMKVSYRIVSDYEDSKECVNDTYFKAWNSIPPHKPVTLLTFLSGIVRQISIDLYRFRHRNKRIENEYTVSLSELEDVASTGDSAIEELEFKHLIEAINAFLTKRLSRDMRIAFVCRYFYFDTIKEISEFLNVSESKVKSDLYRSRQALKQYLIQEGYL